MFFHNKLVSLIILSTYHQDRYVKRILHAKTLTAVR